MARRRIAASLIGISEIENRENACSFLENMDIGSFNWLDLNRRPPRHYPVIERRKNLIDGVCGETRATDNVERRAVAVSIKRITWSSLYSRFMYMQQFARESEE